MAISKNKAKMTFEQARTAKFLAFYSVIQLYSSDNHHYPDYDKINAYQIIEYPGENHHYNTEDKGYYAPYQTTHI